MLDIIEQILKAILGTLLVLPILFVLLLTALHILAALQ